MQDLKSLISCGIGRFFILIFAGRKEHRTGSKMHLKSKKSRSENFRRIERALENTGFSRVPLAEMVGFEPTCLLITDKTISSRSRYDHFDTSP